MNRIVLLLSYHGKKYHGWQIQPNAVSVQSTIEKTIHTLTRETIEIIGCGRTDTGVHASQYFAHFDLNSKEAIQSKSLNALLPSDIAIQKIYLDPLGEFHSRFDAIQRKYIYKLNTNKNPFCVDTSLYYSYNSALDLKKMNELSHFLLQNSSFQSFCKSDSGLLQFTCFLSECQWTQINEHEFEFHIAANRFLRGMVRLIVGACLNYSKDKFSLQQFQTAFLAGQSIPHAWSVPAHGLSLVRVIYPDNIMNRLVGI